MRSTLVAIVLGFMCTAYSIGASASGLANPASNDYCKAPDACYHIQSKANCHCLLGETEYTTMADAAVVRQRALQDYASGKGDRERESKFRKKTNKQGDKFKMKHHKLKKE